MTAATVGAGLAAARRAAPPDHPAVVRGGRAWSFGELGQAAARLAAEIDARRERADAAVGHAFGLGPGGLLALHAIGEAGAPVAPAHPGWRPPERARFLAAIEPELIACEPGSAWATGGEEVSVGGGFPPVVLARRAPAGRTPAPPPGTDALLWTSGSGGRPRVACHGWPGLLRAAAAANERLGFGRDDAWLATLAWAHVGGLAVALRAVLAGAAVRVGPGRFEPRPVREALRAGSTHVSLVPAMLEALLERSVAPPPTALRVALLGGAATGPALLERASAAGWPVALTYGSTEAGSQVATAPPAAVRARPGSVGRPLASVELRLAADGEIELRGPALFLGYLGEPPRDPSDWFPTGDLGCLDEAGELRVIGRRGDRILTGGANVDPLEVEAVLAAHPEVREVCVLGLPDERWGEIVTAVVASRPGGDRATLEARLDRWARERLSGPRAPRGWRWIERLPRTASGKVDRARLRERFSGDEWSAGSRPYDGAERPAERPRAEPGGAGEGKA